MRATNRNLIRAAGAALLVLAASGARAVPATLAQRTHTIVDGKVAVSGGEEACFRLADTSFASDRLLVRVSFVGRIPRGRVSLDGVRSEPFAAQAEEFSFVVSPRGTHRVKLELEESATIDALTVTSTETTIREEACTTYYEEQRRDVDLEAPAETSTNRLGKPLPAKAEAEPPRAPEPVRRESHDARTIPGGTVPAGATLSLTLEGSIDTRSAYNGQAFLSTLERDVAGTTGRVLLPAGTRIEGHVAETQDAGRFGRSTLTLAFDRARLSDGTAVPISGTVQHVGKGSAKKQGGIIAGSAVGGALLGKVLGGDDKDAALGAVLGGAIAAGSIAAKPGESIVLPAGTSLEITLDMPADVPSRPAESSDR